MIDPQSLPRGSNPAPISSPAAARKKGHPWAWIVGIVVTLLLIWGLFGMDHLKLDVEPAAAPATTSAIR
jgi:hypothetical protein